MIALKAIMLYCPLADLDAAEVDAATAGLWTRDLLIRRSVTDGECAYFTTWCPHGTSIDTLVRVEGTRWRIEDSLETAKNELGLDHNETRTWHGWHQSFEPFDWAIGRCSVKADSRTMVGYRYGTIQPLKTGARLRSICGGPEPSSLVVPKRLIEQSTLLSTTSRW